MNTDPVLYLTITPAIAAIIDIICIYKITKWSPPEDIWLKIVGVTIVSGLILFFTIGRLWIIPPTPEEMASSGTFPTDGTSFNWIPVAVAILPGLAGGTIYTYIKHKHRYK